MCDRSCVFTLSQNNGAQVTFGTYSIKSFLILIKIKSTKRVTDAGGEICYYQILVLYMSCKEIKEEYSFVYKQEGEKTEGCIRFMKPLRSYRDCCTRLNESPFSM